MGPCGPVRSTSSSWPPRPAGWRPSVPSWGASRPTFRSPSSSSSISTPATSASCRRSCDRRTPLHVEERPRGPGSKPPPSTSHPPTSISSCPPRAASASRTPDPVHFVRPSADLLFESAARRSPGVPSASSSPGTGSDANMGVRACSRPVAPSSPRIPTRPSSPACRKPPSTPAACDFVLPLEEIGPALVDLVGRGIGDDAPVRRRRPHEHRPRRHGTGEGPRRRARGAPAVHPGRPGLRLHRLQASIGRPPRAPPGPRARFRHPVAVSRRARGRHRRIHDALQHRPHQSHRVLPRSGRVGVPRGGDRPRDHLSSRRGRAHSPVECRVRQSARSPTRSPWWWRTSSASTRRHDGSRSTRPTSTSRPWRRPGAADLLARNPSTTSPRSCGRGTSSPTSIARGWVVTPMLRRTVVFGRLDLTRDPPISRVDLVACRNTLMYLNAETQAFVIPRLQYALRRAAASSSSGEPRWCCAAAPAASLR